MTLDEKMDGTVITEKSGDGRNFHHCVITYMERYIDVNRGIQAQNAWIVQFRGKEIFFFREEGALAYKKLVEGARGQKSFTDIMTEYFDTGLLKEQLPAEQNPFLKAAK